ncbi:MAG TPA: hypothetical protein VKO18_18035 [Terriglobia bacterium]|nr:hypothetical protein [Terriglobia bacterium]
MKRRDFIKSGLGALASTPALGSGTLDQPLAEQEYEEGRKLTLGNPYLDWNLVMTAGTIRSVSLRNKLTDRDYDLSDSKEFQITLSQAKSRIEIPWWYAQRGADNDRSSPDNEAGFAAGHHLVDFRGEERWGTTLNLLMRGGDRVDCPPIFNGYAWFRQWFELPKDAEGAPIVFCLGGCTQEDWNQYWVFLNGQLVGKWQKSGRWRDPQELSLNPGTPEYRALRIGPGEKNLLAIRTYQVDRRYEGMRDEILDRYIFEGRLCDQFISVGQPYVHVADFKLRHWGPTGTAARPGYIFELSNPEHELELTAHYELHDFVRRKWLEIKNASTRERLLLDVDVDDFATQASTSEGDMGFPVVVERELFCAIEHPAGVSQGMKGRVRLRHFPGKTLGAGEALTSKVSIVGVGPKEGARQQFVDYIQAHSPRKGIRAIYDPLGITGFPDEINWVLNDDEMLETTELLEKWQKRGIQFDYYVPDVGWQDWTGDLTRFQPQGFPEGPDKVINRVNQLGMKWGLWFAGSFADWSCGLNPKTVPSRTMQAGGKWPDYTFRDNVDAGLDGDRQLCVASEPYFSMLRDALLYHIHHYNLRFFKLDTGSYFCNSTTHHHLPGKYSTEASYDAVIEIARRAHEAAPDIYIMWYWGIRSPFFALHGDSIFESRIAMEAASTGDFPALYFRDAVTLALDQGGSFNDLIPPMNKDSLGIWLTDTPWGNAMRKERWREALVMDLARGNLLFPQFWGELRWFTDDDVDFLARLQKLAKQNEDLFYKRHTILGDPWNNEVYGYSYFTGAHGFIFMNNVSFESRPVRLRLDATLGLKTDHGGNLRIISHFPDRAELRMSGQSNFRAGQTIETWLRPFEVAMWEVSPEGQVAKDERRSPARDLAAPQAGVTSHHLELQPEPLASWMEINFSEPDTSFRSTMQRPSLAEFESRGYRKRVAAHRAKLPEFAGPQVLAFVLRLRKNDKWWRYQQPADLIQAKAMIGDQTILHFETVPNFRQTGNNEWCGWLVFRIRTNPGWSGKDVVLAISAYLPPEVEIQSEGWVVPQWWGAVLEI